MSFLRSLAALLLAVNTASAQGTSSQPSFFLQDPSDGKPSFVAPRSPHPAPLAPVRATAGNKSSVPSSLFVFRGRES